jgi:hypothetical protein
MKMHHVVIVCCLTVLLTVLDLPLGSCDEVILQKRVSADGEDETPVKKTRAKDRALSAE